jgi:hypothetical protein
LFAWSIWLVNKPKDRVEAYSLVFAEALGLQPAPLFVIPISPSKDKQKFLILLYSNSYKLACLYPFSFFLKV